jgi:Protein of unknown function (DUF5674)
MSRMIQIIHSRATPEQMQQMLEALGIYIKLAVDIQRKILAGGGELHADCEKFLLEDSSEQRDIWVANWLPSIKPLNANPSSTFDPVSAIAL